MSFKRSRIIRRFISPKMAAMIAFALSLFLSVVKAILWLVSGSSAVLASLIDSTQDCALAATNFFAVRYAMKEADEDHRYGHGKMEAIVALGQSAMIVGACIFVVLESIRNFKQDTPPDHPLFIFIVMGGAILINLGLVAYQKTVVRRTKSLAIEADQANYTGDILIHASVIVAIILDVYMGIHWADPVIALIIAIWLLKLSYDIGIKAVDMLMDKELPDEDRDKIKIIIRQTKGVVSSHDLRTHRHGQIIMMSFDIEVDPSLSVIDAHNIAKRVEDSLHKSYPKSEIMIHVDPCGDITDSRHRKIKSHHVK